MSKILEKGQFRLSHVKAKGEWAYNDKKRFTGPKKTDLVVGELFLFGTIGRVVKRLSWSEVSDGMYIQFDGSYENIFFLEFSSQYTSIFSDVGKMPLTCTPSEMGISRELDLEISHVILKNNKEMDLPKSSFDQNGIEGSEESEEETTEDPEEMVSLPEPKIESEESSDKKYLEKEQGRITRVYAHTDKYWIPTSQYDPSTAELKLENNTLVKGGEFYNGRFRFQIVDMAWDYTGWILFIKSDSGHIYAFEFPLDYTYHVNTLGIINAAELHPELTKEKQNEIRLNLTAMTHDCNLPLGTYNNSYKGKSDLRALLEGREERKMKEKETKVEELEPEEEKLSDAIHVRVTKLVQNTSATSSNTPGHIWEGYASYEEGIGNDKKFYVYKTKEFKEVKFSFSFDKVLWISHLSAFYCKNQYGVYYVEHLDGQVLPLRGEYCTIGDIGDPSDLEDLRLIWAPKPKEKPEGKLDLLETSAENPMVITPNMVVSASYTTSSTTTVTGTVMPAPKSNPIVRIEAIMQREKGQNGAVEGSIWEGSISGEQFKDGIPFQVIDNKDRNPVTFYVQTVIDHKPGVYCIFEETHTVYRLDYV